MEVIPIGRGSKSVIVCFFTVVVVVVVAVVAVRLSATFVALLMLECRGRGCRYECLRSIAGNWPEKRRLDGSGRRPGRFEDGRVGKISARNR